jgi:hypothetical protein
MALCQLHRLYSIEYGMTVNDELGGKGKEAVIAYFKQDPYICLKGLEKPTKIPLE